MKTLANDSFLAMVSLTKLFLISLPDAQLIFANSFNGPPDRPPLIDWQFVDFKVCIFFSSLNFRTCLFIIIYGSLFNLIINNLIELNYLVAYLFCETQLLH